MAKPAPKPPAYNFNIVDVPGANSTNIAAVNDQGVVAGTYVSTQNALNFPTTIFFEENSVGVVTETLNFGPYAPEDIHINNQGIAVADQSGPADYPFAFTIVNGQENILGPNVPGTNLYPAGINDQGQIIGSSPLTYPYIGYEYQNGVTTQINFPVNVVPPDTLTTTPVAINNNGDIAGDWFLFDPANLSGVGHKGFLDHNGHFTSIAFPGADNTYVTGMNDHNELVGYYQGADFSTHEFTYQSGKYVSFDLPASLHLVPSSPIGPIPFQIGVNNQGVVVGDGLDSAGLEHGWVYANGNVTQFDVPGAQQTIITDINNLGEIVGNFTDAVGQHGFTATPGGNGHVGHVNTTFDPTLTAGGTSGLGLSTILDNPIPTFLPQTS